MHRELPLRKRYCAAAIVKTVGCSLNGRQGTMACREDAREWLTRKANLAWQKRADIMSEGPQHEISSLASASHVKPPIQSDNLRSYWNMYNVLSHPLTPQYRQGWSLDGCRTVVSVAAPLSEVISKYRNSLAHISPLFLNTVGGGSITTLPRR